ncbi:MAG: hypothetical protein ACI8QY_001191 [bacterium]
MLEGFTMPKKNLKKSKTDLFTLPEFKKLLKANAVHMDTCTIVMCMRAINHFEETGIPADSTYSLYRIEAVSEADLEAKYLLATAPLLKHYMNKGLTRKQYLKKLAPLTNAVNKTLQKLNDKSFPLTVKAKRPPKIKGKAMKK